MADINGELQESNEYYPFGGLIAENSTNRDKQDFKYKGKEYDSMHGLNQYDHSARYYDPANIRFTTMDPHSENYYSWSPYVYVANNPMKFIDPTGMEIRTFYKKQGENKMGQLHSINQSALYVFANSPQGKEFLSNYVQDSQKIGNVNIKGSAKAGINLYIISGPDKLVLKNGKASYVDAWTCTNFNDEGGFDVVIELSYNTDSKGKAIIDIAHEAFIHGVGNFKLANDVNKKGGSKEQKQKNTIIRLLVEMMIIKLIQKMKVKVLLHLMILQIG